MTAFTWTDFLLQGVSALALEEPSLRRNLPLGFANGDLPAAERDRMTREQLQRLLARFDAEPVWAYFRREASASNAPVYTDVLGDRVRGDTLRSDTLVRRRAEVLIEVEPGPDGCVMRFCGQELRFPAHVHPAVEFAREHRCFRVDDLPGCLDGAGKGDLSSDASSPRGCSSACGDGTGADDGLETLEPAGGARGGGRPDDVVHELGRVGGGRWIAVRAGGVVDADENASNGDLPAGAGRSGPRAGRGGPGGARVGRCPPLAPGSDKGSAKRSGLVETLMEKAIRDIAATRGWWSKRSRHCGGRRREALAVAVSATHPGRARRCEETKEWREP